MTESSETANHAMENRPDVLASDDSTAARNESEEGESPSDRVEFLVVSVAGHSYALELGRLRRIARTPPITRVPRTPPVVRGATQVDGEVVAVVDAGTAFDRRAGTVEDSRLVILEREADGETVGLLVDAAETFETVHVSRIALGGEHDLCRASIAPERDEEGAESETVPDGTDSGEDAIDAAGRTPVIDVDALFEAAASRQEPTESK